MTDFLTEKELVLAHYAAIAKATPKNVASILAERTSPDWHWRGFHPFHEQRGATAVASTFWSPFLSSMAHLQRRQDIFFAGANSLDDAKSIWVV